MATTNISVPYKVIPSATDSSKQITISAGSVTFTVTVNGSRINYEITPSGMQSGISTGATPPDYLAFIIRERGGDQYNYYDGVRARIEIPWNEFYKYGGPSGVEDGYFTAQKASGVLQLYLIAEYPYNRDSYDAYLGELSYSGATPYVGPSGTVEIPNTIIAGQSVQVEITQSGGGSLSGTLRRYYKASGSNSFVGSVIQSNITRESLTYTDTIPSNYSGGKVYYELTVSDGMTSAQAISETKTVISNSAPSVPATLTTPSSVGGGGTADISWTASTDPDNNLAGYRLEHSTNGGATWSLVYQGPNLSASETVLSGTQTIRWRVRAYDTYGVSSSWKTSGDATVINNQAPTVPEAPITITPSTLSTGGTTVISWGESTDPDDDAFEYSLERSVNNTTSYTEIYRGTNRYYSDTVGSWETVTYRVRAIDVRGAASGYRTTSTKTVVSNTVPTITCTYADGADLGTKTDVFSITYSVNDADASDTLTVKEYLDGEEKKSFTATRNTDYTFNFKTTANADYWQTVLNGEHSITIFVSDGKATVSRTFTFLKNVGACIITLKNPISAATGKKVDMAAVSFCGDIPAGGITAVQVCADGDQTSPTWETCILAGTEPGYAESGIGNRKKVATDALNEELIGGHYLYIHKMNAAGSKFKFRIQVQKVSDVGGWIGSVQGFFTEASAT